MKRYVIYFVALAAFALALHDETVLSAELIDFRRLEDAPRDARTFFAPTSISADGSVIGLYEAVGDFSGWIWSRENGFEQAPIDDHWLTTAISGDGNVIALNNSENNHKTLIWDRTSNETTTIDSDSSSSSELSHDGAIAATNAGDSLFRWTESTGLEPIDIPGSWDDHYVTGMSSDGSTIVGGMNAGWIRSPDGNYNLESDGFIWHDGQAQELHLPHTGDPNIYSSNAIDVSSDGQIVLVRAEQELLKFDVNGNEFQNLGPVVVDGEQYDIRDAQLTDHGAITIYARRNSDQGVTGIVWDKVHGYQYLEEVLRDEHGIEFPSSMKLMWPSVVSQDARAIAGVWKPISGSNPVSSSR
ncbi:MAG: hypothetical protein KDB27_34795 [Planctomycetales bacterium]|nr:hypothetical protein [Planctomycetales bacterium]